MTSPQPAPQDKKPGFMWFSQRVDECLAAPDSLDALRRLIDEAEADKQAGYGPPQDDINRARRKWLALYEAIYRRVA